jgi:outer membrane protein assembly factor BamA
MSHQLEKRLNDKWSAGARLTTLSSTTTFVVDSEDLPYSPTLPGVNETVDLSSLSLIATYDTRDNLISPTTGTLLKATPQYYSEALGSSINFGRIDFLFLKYFDLDSTYLGIRVQGGLSENEAPFFMLPFVEQRGVPKMRYQGTFAVAVEAEMTFPINDRWKANIFGGVGWASNSIFDQTFTESVVAGGVGLRYLMAQKLSLWVGLDFAVSEADTAVYLVIGNSWK